VILDHLRRHWRPVVASVVALAVGIGATSVANAAFNDVPSEAQYAEHVENAQNAGIATGFDDGTFRPRNALSRQQAATWLGRSAGRLDYDYHLAYDASPQSQGLDAMAEASTIALEGGPEAGSVGGPLTPADPVRTVATVTMEPAGADGGDGFVLLDGEFMAAAANGTGAGCPCAIDIAVYDEDEVEVGYAMMTAPGPSEDDERDVVGSFTSATVNNVIPVTGGDARTFTAVATLSDSDVNGVVLAGSLTVTYVPFGPEGGDDLG